MAPNVLIIDNYDSFVYNLVQYLGELGADPTVRRPDELAVNQIGSLSPDAILISPGPGTPTEAELSNEIISRYSGQIPILGVCLGMQCMAEVFGATVVRADQVVHGKTSAVSHNGSGLFVGLPNPLEATRYHSLVVDPTTMTAELEVTAQTEDGTIMALQHRDHPTAGVQFHPESVLSIGGHDLLTNFLNLTTS